MTVDTFYNTDNITGAIVQGDSKDVFFINVPSYTHLYKIKDVSPQFFYAAILPGAEIPLENPEKAAFEEFKIRLHGYDSEDALTTNDGYRRRIEEYKLDVLNIEYQRFPLSAKYNVEHNLYPDMQKKAFETYVKCMRDISVNQVCSRFPDEHKFIEKTLARYALADATAEFYNELAKQRGFEGKEHDFRYCVD